MAKKVVSQSYLLFARPHADRGHGGQFLLVVPGTSAPQVSGQFFFKPWTDYDKR